jgi:hypothetical protein
MRRNVRARLIRIAAATLVALHAILLWRRVSDLSIAEPLVIVRWCAAAAAAVVALALIHRRASWRAWAVFWIAIVLLHTIAPAPMVILQTATLAALGCGVAFARPIERLSILRPFRVAFHATLFVPLFATRAPPSF